jgi:release factor glutamine methyltransferase
VTEWEPREALLAGPDGLDTIRALLDNCVRGSGRIATESASSPPLDADVLALEVGADQAPAVGELLRQAGFGDVETRRDLAGIERVVIGRREGA